MRKASTKKRQFPPKLERLLLDADVNAYLGRYLESIGFDVLFAPKVTVNIRDDTAVLKWARRRRRILVCHDRFKDGQTRTKLFFEIFQNGGRVIRIGGGPQQSIQSSLGKILVQRRHWLDFFAEHEHGMVVVHEQGMRKLTREDLYRQLQGVLVDPVAALERPKKPRKYRPRKREVPPAQLGPIL